MKQIITNVYSYEELPPEIQKKVLNKYWHINVDPGWWDSDFEDAKTIGLEIKEFDLDRANFLEGHFISSPVETAESIIEHHGRGCDTFKYAEEFLNDIEELKKANGILEDEHFAENALKDLEDAFLVNLFNCYKKQLQESYEYLTSKDVIIETFEANEYTFTIEGKMMNS